jgi:plastocyanin
MNLAGTSTVRHRLSAGRWRTVAVGVTLLVLATDCVGDDDDSAAATETDTTVAVTESTVAPMAPMAPAGVTVTINTFNFQPDPLTVAAGTVITFVNEDAIDHTVTAGTRENPQPDLFNGVLPEEGATFELVLDEPGTYDYFCSRHSGPGMTGTIVVE